MQASVDIMLMDAASAQPAELLLPRLHPEEQARYRGFGNDTRRESWRAGRALALAALSLRLGEVDAMALRTVESGGLRYADGGLHLNLSHSHGLVGVALATVPVGLDLEWPKPRTSVEKAARVFAPEEGSYLDSLPAAERQVAFYTLWTLKEAACKAVGLSILSSLKHARFDLVTRRFAPSQPLPPAPWTLLYAGLSSGWHLALGLKAADPAPEVRCRRLAAGMWQEETLVQPVWLYAR